MVKCDPFILWAPMDVLGPHTYIHTYIHTFTYTHTYIDT